MSFTVDLSSFVRKTNDKLESTVKRIVAGVAESVIEMSPVGDASYWKSPPPKGYLGGRFRGNWDYGFNSIPGAQYENIDPTGAASMGRVTGGLSGKTAVGNVHYIINSLPYAKALEDGWSRQAPQGMVGLTVLRFQQIVNGSV